MTDEETKITPRELQILGQVLDALRGLDSEGQLRILQTAATFFGLSTSTAVRGSYSSRTLVGVEESGHGSFSEDRSISPKAFLMEKEPKSDVERVACLAYYLTHYRDTPHFKTLDISKLNTEAAQIKFSNAAFAVNNATKAHYLVPAARSAKQLSAMGEQFVLALPNRDAARAVMANSRGRRRSKKPSQADQVFESESAAQDSITENNHDE